MPEDDGIALGTTVPGFSLTTIMKKNLYWFWKLRKIDNSRKIMMKRNDGHDDDLSILCHSSESTKARSAITFWIFVYSCLITLQT